MKAHPRLAFRALRVGKRAPRVTTSPLILALILASGSMAPSPARGEFPLVEGGRAAVLVADPTEARNPDLARAIADLREWMAAAGGSPPDLRMGGTRPAGPAVFIGKAARDQGLAVQPSELGAGGYLIKSSPTTLALAGADPAGAANAIYDVASTYLGVRVHAPGPDGVTVPKNATVRVPDGLRRERPALDLRQAWFNENVLAGTRDAEREAMRLFARRHRGGGIGAVIRHYYAELVPPATYFKEHPEYFAEIGGKRVADGQLCTSNPDVIAITAEHWIDRFTREPDLAVGSLSPNDGSRFCTCTACKSDGPDLATRYVRFANKVAERVAARHPHRFLAFYAYADLVEPPYDKGIRLNANLIPIVARFGICQAHAIDERGCPTNAAFKRRLDGWAAIARQIMARDYACPWPVPDLTIDVLAANLRTYRQAGSRGMSREYQQRGYLSDLLMAVDLELMWNPAADADSILADLCRARYGAAAPPVLAVVKDLRRPIESVPVDRTLSGDAPSAAGIYTTEQLAAAAARLAELARTEGAPVKARLEADADLLRAAELQLVATAAVDRYKRSGRDEDRAAATAKLAAAKGQAQQLAAAGHIGSNAVSDLERLEKGLVATGLAAPLSGPFDYRDDLARGGFSRRDANLIEGFYPGTYGLSLHPGKSGQVAYTFTATPGKTFVKAEIHDLVLRGSPARIEVQAGGRTTPVGSGAALDNRDLVHDLTPIVAGKDRFTITIWAQNATDKAMLCLDNIGVRGEVR
jgi:hypothetical protein